MANIKTGLLAAAFPSGKQKGPKKGEGSGDTQHGELANSDTPKKVAKVKGTRAGEKEGKRKPAEGGGGDFDLSRNGGQNKLDTKTPKLMEHETKKVLKGGMFSLGGKDGESMSPAEHVMQSAHRAKMNATESWISGYKSTEEHDAVHRRANKVLKSAKRGR